MFYLWTRQRRVDVVRNERNHNAIFITGKQYYRTVTFGNIVVYFFERPLPLLNPASMKNIFARETPNFPLY